MPDERVNPKDEICREMLAAWEADCVQDRKDERDQRIIFRLLLIAGLIYLAGLIALMFIFLPK